MEINGTIDLLTFSGIRRDALLYLINGPKKLDEIKDHLGLKTPEIQPHLKKLELNGIIEKAGDLYTLTQLGNIAAHYLEIFYETTAAIDSNKEFWDNHDLSVIPQKLLLDIRKLKSCHVAVTKNYTIGEPHPDFIKIAKSASRIKGVTSVINPFWIDVFIEISSKPVQLEIIVTLDVYDEIINKYPDKLEQLLKNKNSHIYVCDDDIKIAFSSMCGDNGPFLSIGLYNKNTQCYDNLNDLEGHDFESMSWGDQLFEYYKDISVKIEMETEHVDYKMEKEIVKIK